MLQRAGREDDYVEIGLDTGVCYNPLHNDLDPYAVAYAIATLLNNLFGKIEGAVLAAGVHRSAEVRDPAAAAHRRLHDARRGVPLHPGRPADRPRHPRAEGAARRAAGRHRVLDATSTTCTDDAARLDAIGSRTTTTTWRTRTMRSSRRYLAAQGMPYRRATGPGRAVGPTAGTSSRPSSAGTCTAGVGSTRGSARRSPKASSCSCRCSTTTPPCTGRSVRRASAYLGTPRAGRAATAAAARRRCSKPGHVLAPELPGGHEPGAGPRSSA